MNSKMMHQAGRVLVALVLVVCLLVAWSPIRAEATTAAAALSVVAIPAALVIGSLIISLGVLPSSNSAAFDTLVDSVIDGLALGEVLDLVAWVSGGFQRYAVPEWLIEDVRDYLYAESVITTSSVYGTAWLTAGTYGDVYISKSCYSFVVNYENRYLWFIVNPTIGGNSMYIKLDGSRYSANSSTLSVGVVTWWVFNVSATTSDEYGIPCVSDIAQDYYFYLENFFNGVYPFSPSNLTVNSVSVSSEFLNADLLAARDDTLSDVYVTWGSSALNVYEYSDGSLSEDPGDEENEQIPVPYWPISIGQTYEETISQTQEEAQSGESTYVDPDSAGVGDVFSQLVSLPSRIADAFSKFLSDIPSLLENIWNAILSIPQMIADLVVSGISAIFVPSEDFLTEKVEAIRAEFGFADSIIATGELLSNTFSGINTEPPVIYIDLGAAEGSYYLGSKEVFLDLSWYSRYKKTGDAIISAFLWITFIWRFLLKAPGIISGMPGEFFLPQATNESVAVRREDRRHDK